MRTILCTLLLVISPLCLAHVGSPDVFFESNAGPYHLFVTVRMPPTVPGIADIEIHSDSADISGIRIVPMRLTGAGSQMEPTPDDAEPSKHDPQLFRGHLWLMEFHALQVRIEANGRQGKGELAVPIMAEAQRTLTMQKPLGAVLFGLMLLLVLGCVSIVRAAAGEAKLAPDTILDARENPRLRRVAFVTTLIIVGIIFAGSRWWSAQARMYADMVFRPPHLMASLQPGSRLVLSAPEGKWTTYKWSDLVRPDNLMPDHSHPMHLFLVCMPEMDHFLHLHPEPDARGFFSQNLPTLPAGRYQMFGDVVTKTGWALTLTGEVVLPNVVGRPLTGDDSGIAAPSLTSSAPRMASGLPDGGRMILEMDSSPLRARTAMHLRFRLQDAEEKPAQDLESFMGMPGHLVVMSTDGSVFAHVHPSGSPAMATLELVQNRPLVDSHSLATHPHASPSSKQAFSEISFPFGFPKPGEYRLFVQVKRGGRIETGVFDVGVVE